MTIQITNSYESQKENCEIDETKEEKKEFEELKTKFEPDFKKNKDIIRSDCEKVIVLKKLIIATVLLLQANMESKLSNLTSNQALPDTIIPFYTHVTKENTQIELQASCCCKTCSST